MPIRFQIDPDFYDHPKVLGLSDAAIALWARAGSYSVAKRTDGFIPENALSLFSETQQAAVPELVRHRLWHKVRGGYQFHQFDERNLTRARIEADQRHERERKQRQRQEARSGVNGHVNTVAVPPGQPPGRPVGHVTPVPGVSVSVSESVSVSGSVYGRAALTGPTVALPLLRISEPPRNCPQHLDNPNPPPCGLCRDTRLAHEQWQAAKRARVDSAPRCAEHPGELAANCRACAADRKVAAARFGAPPNERQT